VELFLWVIWRGGIVRTKNGLLGAVRRHAYGTVQGYQNQEDDSLGVLPVHDKGSDKRYLQE
jgi:hypothetical protein